ncbi:hypothetical protein E3E12_04590 [Formicincola oecophyllae]|uniref:Uncharacterized protein n=1 Tax=Formicincola oecophyllae TaxID=2558361 RepID=A0A4Y6U832_9PROT|nr:hypothetical protein [Formicincola oecophyllae]QDH13589.1 hypothetical protein E3E12_04590 [Formicincola oecophyllae]
MNTPPTSPHTSIPTNAQQDNGLRVGWDGWHWGFDEATDQPVRFASKSALQAWIATAPKGRRWRMRSATARDWRHNNPGRTIAAGDAGEEAAHPSPWP